MYFYLENYIFCYIYINISLYNNVYSTKNEWIIFFNAYLYFLGLMDKTDNFHYTCQSVVK